MQSRKGIRGYLPFIVLVAFGEVVEVESRPHLCVTMIRQGHIFRYLHNLPQTIHTESLTIPLLHLQIPVHPLDSSLSQ